MTFNPFDANLPTPSPAWTGRDETSSTIVSERRFKALDLFSGAGGVSMGLHRAGFEVVGVDINPQPRYPFEFHQADALTFPLDGFDIVCGSPICKGKTTLKALWPSRTYPDQIAPLRARLVAAGVSYVIENVAGAKLHNPVMLCGTMFGLKVFRHRFFESNVPLVAPRHASHDGATGSHRWPYSPMNGYVQVTGNGGNYKLDEGRRAMGIPWMNKAELSQAIPPDYAEHLGRQVMAYLIQTNERAA